MGSISSGTMRGEDLIPEFLWELHGLAKTHGKHVDKATRRGHLRLCREIQGRINNEHNYYSNSDATDYDLESLFDALGEYAGPYFYFGAHPGDGADYGFWLSDTFGDYDFEGLKVSDLSEVPKDYAGEILHINDHGNMSLYNKARTQEPREIWAVV